MTLALGRLLADGVGAQDVAGELDTDAARHHLKSTVQNVILLRHRRRRENKLDRLSLGETFLRGPIVEAR
jgi:hypothetical protein